MHANRTSEYVYKYGSQSVIKMARFWLETVVLQSSNVSCSATQRVIIVDRVTKSKIKDTRVLLTSTLASIAIKRMNTVKFQTVTTIATHYSVQLTIWRIYLKFETLIQTTTTITTHFHHHHHSLLLRRLSTACHPNCFHFSTFTTTATTTATFQSKQKQQQHHPSSQNHSYLSYVFLVESGWFDGETGDLTTRFFFLRFLTQLEQNSIVWT